ncbi:uncharacterized protein PHALS_13820 [Plasmopara halstedii]|uniref:Uncharacterized protein n=1 Tax=Plasmopara halstedii TaxID=4781 RepID=A0A0P1ARR0_PLAHL|nr:uncharacterized protein PHALS_13820 [Plasmopara halstedii]CEG43629.1 hypothetical protein PHALS_13820 [Plasmopara halstedii]|eukprot:XP_024579998.1 hypothetical protein PHALS_13820 [Plasmopara halstedii]
MDSARSPRSRIQFAFEDRPLASNVSLSSPLYRRPPYRIKSHIVVYHGTNWLFL